MEWARSIYKEVILEQDPSSFVFTSSGGVYTEKKGAPVDEASPVNESSPYYKKILGAEEAVVKAGGTVLR